MYQDLSLVVLCVENITLVPEKRCIGTDVSVHAVTKVVKEEEN